MARFRVGYNVSPSFVDIDNDEKTDLFVGSASGRIWWYRRLEEWKKVLKVNPYHEKARKCLEDTQKKIIDN